MKVLFYSIILILFFQVANGQEQPRGMVLDPEFGKMIDSYLDFTVPVISCPSLFRNQDQFIILDAREIEEYQVSHLKDAIHVGFHDVNLKDLDKVDKKRPVVVYCSIGYRSEKIGNRLQEMGFSRVYNLYGSIFEWANRGYPLYHQSGEEIKKVHTYNKKWSRWVETKDIEKIW